MRKAQEALTRFFPLVRWQRFRRSNLNAGIEASDRALATFGCSDAEQAVVWLLRTDSVTKDGTVGEKPDAPPAFVHVPHLKKGRYALTVWNTVAGSAERVLKLPTPIGLFCVFRCRR